MANPTVYSPFPALIAINLVLMHLDHRPPLDKRRPRGSRLRICDDFRTAIRGNSGLPLDLECA
jgi:hypothetical protein